VAVSQALCLEHCMVTSLRYFFVVFSTYAAQLILPNSFGNNNIGLEGSMGLSTAMTSVHCKLTTLKFVFLLIFFFFFFFFFF
jgi:hypothetical protein